jgi:membrane complex biogenesis BtpA family protein
MALDNSGGTADEAAIDERRPAGDLFEDGATVIGMVHLPALPGSPGFDGDRAAIRRAMVRDARALVDGGVDALLIENFGDAPFHPDDVPKHVVADLASLTTTLRGTVSVPIGVNVLRNDAAAALSVAAAAGGSFVRVNVHTGARLADQGVIEGRAHETLRLRERLGVDSRDRGDRSKVAILADVAVKHAAPLADRPLEAIVEETIERGRADGLVVSGPATGESVSDRALETVVSRRDAVDTGVPVLVGSGVTPETVDQVLDLADGAVVGTALKENRAVEKSVDPAVVATLVERARAGDESSGE